MTPFQPAGRLEVHQTGGAGQTYDSGVREGLTHPLHRAAPEKTVRKASHVAIEVTPAPARRRSMQQRLAALPRIHP